MPSGHDALIVLGGGQNALDDESIPSFPFAARPDARFRRQRPLRARRLPGQPAAGARLWRENLLGAAPEFGWHTVLRTEEAKADPVLGVAPEASDLPVARRHLHPAIRQRRISPAIRHCRQTRLFASAAPPMASSSISRPIARQVSRWNTVFADILAEHQPGWAAHGEEAARHGPMADAAGLAIARAWVGTIRGPFGSNGCPI